MSDSAGPFLTSVCLLLCLRTSVDFPAGRYGSYLIFSVTHISGIYHFGYLPFRVFTLNSTRTWRLRRLLRRYCFSSYRYRRVMGIGAIDSARLGIQKIMYLETAFHFSKLMFSKQQFNEHTLRFAVDHRSYRFRDPRCPITFNKIHLTKICKSTPRPCFWPPYSSHSLQIQGLEWKHTSYRGEYSRRYIILPSNANSLL